MELPRVRLLFLGAMTVSLVLAGCSTAPKRSQSVSKEQFLKSTGKVQSENGADDPLAMHLAARAQVDPRDLSTHHAYTTTPTKEQVYGQDDVRVVKLATMATESEEQIVVSPVPVQVQVEPVQSARTAPQNIAPAAGSPATSEVTAVRIGEHSNKTRLVLDMTGPGKFSYDINRTGTSLTILLPQSAWNVSAQKPATSALIRNYSAVPIAGGGVAVNIELKKPGRLAYGGALPPNDIHGDRIVFDVAPL
jgi:hypothetical protein